MSPAAASSAYDVRTPAIDPACTKCGSGPLLESERARGLCPDCQKKARVYARCQLCSVHLGTNDDRTRGLCTDCQKRPEARRLGPDGRALIAKPQTSAATSAPGQASEPAQKRPFTVAEKSLIRHMHHILPPTELLRILNDRLVADVGAGAPLWTLEQLHAETSTLQQTGRAMDWSGLRQIVHLARQGGVLEQITPQVINDFAVVFQLSSAQVMNLRDVIRSAREG